MGSAGARAQARAPSGTPPLALMAGSPCKTSKLLHGMYNTHHIICIPCTMPRNTCHSELVRSAVLVWCCLRASCLLWNGILLLYQCICGVKRHATCGVQSPWSSKVAPHHLTSTSPSSSSRGVRRLDMLILQGHACYYRHHGDLHVPCSWTWLVALLLHYAHIHGHPACWCACFTALAC
jgi:hypothetical protein